ncbi:hypothetical protein ABGB18_02090 [Nonomuraea sp. B12E4]|uniref:hypothetical protein n=1 Tax=Nonomuraea sp. B12E4 TaxID=3153564 RepID=UPI00325E9610
MKGMGKAGDVGDVEGVAVQMEGVDVVGDVAEAQPVALAALDRQDRLVGAHVERLAVQGPDVEPLISGVALLYQHVHDVVGPHGRWAGLVSSLSLPCRLGSGGFVVRFVRKPAHWDSSPPLYDGG